MATNSTVPTTQSVDDFLAAVPDERRRVDAVALRGLMERVSGAPAAMWGPSMIGFGERHYRYDSGREGDTFVLGFSPRKTALVIYGVHDGDAEQPDPLLADLGPHRTGKGCLYVTSLSAIDLGVLERLVRAAVEAASS